MESRTYMKNVKVSPKKLRFFLPQITSMTPQEAVERLAYMPQTPARVLYNAIRSAMANARTVLKVQDDALVFQTLLVEEGQKLRRYHAGSRGMAKPYKKRFSHIKIVLGVRAQAQKPVSAKKVRSTKTIESQPKKGKAGSVSKKAPVKRKKSAVRKNSD